ncbi:hypothetical protein [Burkholderia phage FLC9]|nr:hypothetical protein [Burkholderia phage FLC9]
MESLLLLLALSGGFSFGVTMWARKHIERRVLIALFLIGPIVTLAGYGGVLFHNRIDTEIWNGEITKKVREEVSCEHSYECNCSTDKDGRKTCSTCYEHNFDVDWKLENNAGNDIKIRRVDRQGIDEPPRWSQAQVGDPVAQDHYFVNYVMGAKDSLFNNQDAQTAFKQFKPLIPEYPDNVYDYYKLKRVLLVGNVPMDDLKLNAWNQQLALMLRPLGPEKQVNVIIVLTSVQDPNFANALRTAWLGGKKNDVVVVIGTADYPKVNWARIVSWTDNETFKVELADAIQDKGTLDPVDTTTMIGGFIVKDFHRKHMKDFNYLAWESAPTIGTCAIIAICSLLATAIAFYVFLNKTPRRRHYRY